MSKAASLAGFATAIVPKSNLTVGIVTASYVSVASSVSATTFYGSGENLTGIAVTANIRADRLVVAGVTTVSAGSAAAPSIVTNGDPNTGVFFPAADSIAISNGGAEAARFDSNGRLGIGTDSVTGVGGKIVHVNSPNTISELHLTNSTSGSGSQDGLTHILNGVDAYAYNRENGEYVFGTNNTERSRITSGGQFLVGTTSPSVHAPSNLVVQRDQTWRCASNGNVSHHRIACARYSQGQGNRLVTFNVPVTAQFGGFACFMEVFMTAHRGYVDTAQSRMGKAYFSIARQGGGNSNVVITSNVGSQNWNGLTTTLGSSYTPRDLVTYITLTRAGSEASTATQAVGLELAAWDNVTVVGYISAIVDITVINETGSNFTWTIT